MLSNAMVVIIIQYIKVSSQHVVHIELIQCYVSIIFQAGGEIKQNE